MKTHPHPAAKHGSSSRDEWFQLQVVNLLRELSALLALVAILLACILVAVLS